MLYFISKTTLNPWILTISVTTLTAVIFYSALLSSIIFCRTFSTATYYMLRYTLQIEYFINMPTRMHHLICLNMWHNGCHAACMLHKTGFTAENNKKKIKNEEWSVKGEGNYGCKNHIIYTYTHAHMHTLKYIKSTSTCTHAH